MQGSTHTQIGTHTTLGAREHTHTHYLRENRGFFGEGVRKRERGHKHTKTSRGKGDIGGREDTYTHYH